ncbi:unnamed protein product [Closterium sp. Yama58-4]|nr:unnamed protein product [Closterium sp. Yama58-4]
MLLLITLSLIPFSPPSFPLPSQVATGPESRQVLGPCSPAQQRNIALCMLLSLQALSPAKSLAPARQRSSATSPSACCWEQCTPAACTCSLFSPPHPPGCHWSRVPASPGPMLASAAAQHLPVRAPWGGTHALRAAADYLPFFSTPLMLCRLQQALNPVKSSPPARQRSSATSPPACCWERCTPAACTPSLLSPSPRSPYAFQVATGPESRQVLGPCSPAQQRNIALCVLLGAVHARCMRLLARLPEEADAVMEAGVGSVHGVAMDAVAPLFKAMRDRIEACLLQIHQQDFASDDPNAPPASTTPPPLGAASRNLPCKAVSSNYETISVSSIFSAPLSGAAASGPLSPSTALPQATVSEPVAQSLAKRLASRTLLFFVRHASLVRPLSEAGRLRLARDMGELEFAVGQHLFPTHALGASYRALRAFRPLLFLDLDKIPTSSLLQDLPPSVVLHHLFSRAPPELLSPFTRIQQPPARYLLWLDQHSQQQAWQGIKARMSCAFSPSVRIRQTTHSPSPRLPSLLSQHTQDLPPSVVLHHLFSRAPPELLSPFTRIQQPPARYSLWLDQHSQQQAWQGKSSRQSSTYARHTHFSCALFSFCRNLSVRSLPFPSLASPPPPHNPTQDLPPSVVLHHLFSRAPPELLSPFTRIQQPPARYSLWLDQHSQQQAWQGIKASLDDYVGSVKARGGKEFHPVYSVMLQLGQTLLAGGNEG